jgi:hypothetical protein
MRENIKINVIFFPGGTGFKSGPGIGYSDWTFRVFPQSLPDCTLKVSHDRFLLYPFQFIIHLSPFHSTLCTLSY